MEQKFLESEIETYKKYTNNKKKLIALIILKL